MANENKRQKAEILLKREIGLAPGQTDSTHRSCSVQLNSRAVRPTSLRTEAYANRQDYQNAQQQQIRGLRKSLAARSKRSVCQR